MWKDSCNNFCYVFKTNTVFEKSITQSNFSFKSSFFYDFVTNSRIESIVCKQAKSKDMLNLLFDSSEQKSLLSRSNQRLIKTLSNIQAGLEVAELFKSNNIDFILLKGFFLSNFIYENRADRPINDVDILVKKKDLMSAKSLIENHLNYKQQSIKHTNLRFHINPFLSQDNLARVEIHYQIFKDNEKRIEDLVFNSVREIKFKSNKLYFLKSELNLLHLIFHGTSSGNLDVGIQYLLDIKFILEKEKINFDCLFKLAKKLNLLNELNLTLVLIRDIFEIKTQKHFLYFEPPQNVIESSKRLLFQTMPQDSLLAIFYKNSLIESVFDVQSLKKRNIFSLAISFFARLKRVNTKSLQILFNLALKKRYQNIIISKKLINSFFNNELKNK